MIDAAERQQLPTGDGRDVASVVTQILSADTDYALLVPDIEARVASGEKKYGMRLKTNNGRNVDLDLYQELLDGLNYSTQAFLQPDNPTYMAIFYDLARLALKIKRILTTLETLHANDQKDNLDMDFPLVSCITPTYNRRHFSPRAVRCFLSQDYPNLEWVILDDGTDPIKDLLPDDPRIKYHPIPPKLAPDLKMDHCFELSRGIWHRI